MIPTNADSTNDDHIFIERFQLTCRVGTTIEERSSPQTLLVSIRMYLPLKEAGRTDQIDKTVDYAPIIEKIKLRISTREFILLESVAAEIAEIVAKQKRIESVDVHVAKKSFPGVESVGVFMNRKKARR